MITSGPDVNAGLGVFWSCNITNNQATGGRVRELIARTEKVNALALDMLAALEKYGADTDMAYSAMLIVNDAVSYQRKTEEMLRYAVAQLPNNTSGGLR